MRVILTLFILCFVFTATAQNIKRIIDKKDIATLKSYINDVEYIEDEIMISANRYENKKKVVINPLEYSVLVGDFEMVKLLTKKQNKYEDFNETVSKAFAIALMENNQQISAYLFKFNPNVNEICSICQGNTPIMWAVKNGNKEWYFKLNQTSELFLVNDEGDNLAHLCANHFNNDIFNDVLAKEVDINLSNNNKKTPLQVAALKGAYTMFFKLIELSANYETIEDLFADAILGGNIKIINYFTDKTIFNSEFLWLNYSYKIGSEKPKDYFPYELAILSNNSIALDFVLDNMMSDLQKDSTNKHIKNTYELLSGIGDDFDYVSLTHSIAMGQKEMFEKILKTSVEFNKRNYNITYQATNGNFTYQQPAQVYFTKFDFRAAKRQFGKKYVIDLYKKLGIEF